MLYNTREKGEKERLYRVVVERNVRNSSIFLLQLIDRKPSSISRKISGSVVAVWGQLRLQIFPCSRLYLLSKSIISPKVHSFQAVVGV